MIHFLFVVLRMISHSITFLSLDHQQLTWLFPTKTSKQHNEHWKFEPFILQNTWLATDIKTYLIIIVIKKNLPNREPKKGHGGGFMISIKWYFVVSLLFSL